MTDALDGPSFANPRLTTPAPRRTWRWLIALFTTAVMLLGTTGVAVFAQAGASGVSGPSFVPSGAVAYVEARLDLPGDQRDQLLAFLAHIPGFADSSTFDLKVDEFLDKQFGQGGLLYTRDIKPWSDGRIVVGLTAIPTDMSSPAAIPVVAGLGVKDRAALESLVPPLLASGGATVTTVDYAGTTLSTVTNGTSTPVIYAITDSYLLISPDLDAIKASVDVLGGAASLAQDAAFTKAMSTLPADHVAAFYVDTAQLRDPLTLLFQQMVATNPGAAAMADQITAGLAALPDQLSGAVRVDADHLTIEFQAVAGPNTPTLTVRTTDLAARMPADTMAYVETRDLGATIGALIAQLKPQLVTSMGEQGLAQIEQLLGAGIDQYFSFVQDASVGVSVGTAGVSVGIAATVTDEALALQRVSALATLLRAVGSSATSPITVTEEDVAGVTVTTISVDSAVLPPNLPIEPRISIAVGDGLLLIGLGDFVSQALQRDPADSLASSTRYATAIGAAGTPSAGLAWVDIAGVSNLIGSMLTGSAATTFQNDVKPFLDALDQFVASTAEADGIISVRALLYVK